MEQFTEIELENEEWRPVVGYEGFYEVSSLGRVRSIGNKSDGTAKKEIYRKPQGTLYLTVDLWRNNKPDNKLLHRLVAEAFLPNPDNLPEVNHKDLDTSNCRLSNLEWVSVSDNNLHKNKNRAANQPYRTQVLCLETDEIFKSISAAGRSVSADATQIVESIQAQRCCKGFTFVYVDKMPDNPEEYMKQAHEKYQSFHRRPNMKNSRKVKVVESGQIFDSIAEAARFFSCDPATINNRIKAKKAFNNVTLVFEDESL